MRKFIPQFDHVVLLTAPEHVLIQRLTARPQGGYRRTPDELARVLELYRTVEPALRRIATLELDTNAELNDTVNRLLSLVTE